MHSNVLTRLRNDQLSGYTTFNTKFCVVAIYNIGRDVHIDADLIYSHVIYDMAKELE